MYPPSMPRQWLFWHTGASYHPEGVYRLLH